MTMRTIWVKFKTVTSMKKLFSNLMLVAAAAMAFFACQKPEAIAPEDSQEVMLTFASEKPTFDDDTKTEWNGSTIQWSAGDKISVAYTVNDKWMGYKPEDSDTESAPKLYKSEALENSRATAKFNVSGNFNIDAVGTHVFHGVYPAPSSTSFENAPEVTLTIPALQTPKASSFDASADLMTGVSVDEFSSLPEADEEISMLWTRLVAHANITLKSINGIVAGEKIYSITLTAQEDANLVGKQKINLLTNEVSKAVASAKTNEVELNGGNLVVDANGNVEFWACILPVTLTSLNVEVETDKATYTREITGISKTFKQNARNTLSVKMDGATRVEKVLESWRLVTPTEGITEGTYAIVAKTSTKTGVLINSNGTGSAPTFYTTGISIEDDCLSGVADIMQFDITGTAGNYILYVGGDASKWLYCTNDNNGVRVGNNSNKSWSITTHSTNNNAFAFKHNGTNRYLGVYNDADWRCYTSLTATNFTNAKGSSQIYLYKKVSAVAPDTTPELKVDKTSVELTSDGGEGTIAVTAANVTSLQVRALVAEGSQDEVLWLSVEYDENGTLSYAAEANSSENLREAYIEIYAEDLNGNPLTKYIHVLQAGKAEGGETPEPEEPTRTPRNLTFSAATATATVGQAFTAPTLNGVTAGVTYSSSNTAVATVNASTGAVTPVGEGTTTITATALETSEYEAGTASYTLTVNAAQGGGQQTTTTYTFNSKSWGDSTNSWTSGKAGNQLTSGQGVQVTTGVSGANATCKNSFSNVSTVVVKYCTNASKGAGTIKVTIGSVTKTFTVSTSGGTSLRNATFDFNGATGTPKIEVTCTTNSIYVNAISITHTN